MSNGNLLVGLVHTLAFSERLGISRKEAADIWGVSPTTFDKLVRAGKAPQPKSINRRKVWHRLDVEEAFNHLCGRPSSSAAENEWDRLLQ